VARKRRKLMARVRLVSVLSVIALIVAIAWGVNDIFKPEPPPTDLRAELLRLLAEGQLTPEQAIQLAQILETGALGETQSASLEEAPASGPAPMATTRSGDARFASVSEAAFDSDARETYREAFQSLSRHPDAQVRLAAAQMSQDSSRQAAMQTLWTYAQNHPDDPLREQMFLLCGSVGEANDDPLGQRALEVAANVSTNDPAVWRMLSRSYRRTDRTGEAQGAALVSEAVVAQSQGQTEMAEERLQQALPNLTTPEVRAPVVSGLGQIAEQRNDWTSASARYAEAYRLREQSVRQAPTRAAASELDADAQQLVIALDRSGRTGEACERLRQAQEAHDVAAPNQDVLERCQRLFSTQLESRVELAPLLRSESAEPQRRLRATDVHRVAPAPVE
jgi:tetratricopeptide (TPR) repeat protein